jgi:NADH-quinone oxidoreductase subunit C
MLIERLKERYGSAILAAESARDEETIVIDRDRAHEVMQMLHDDPALSFNFLSDLTAVDWPERTPRFDVVYHLRSLTHGHRLRVKIGVDGTDPWVHSVALVWKAADWLERECYDMFGIRFEGHPDLRRILLYDSFVGHPLRKDYPYNRRQPLVEEVDPVIHPRQPSR